MSLVVFYFLEDIFFTLEEEEVCLMMIEVPRLMAPVVLAVEAVVGWAGGGGSCDMLAPREPPESS